MTCQFQVFSDPTSPDAQPCPKPARFVATGTIVHNACICADHALRFVREAAADPDSRLVLRTIAGTGGAD